MLRTFSILFLLLSWCVVFADNNKFLVGAYYFEGWSGARKDTSSWAKGLPTHVTKKLFTEYAGREPLWGWRDDDVHIMERQIDLASNNGIDFFIFCWYWQDSEGSLDIHSVLSMPENTGLSLFLRAKNRDKMKFSILVCNHHGSIIKGHDNWMQLIDFFSTNYFCNQQYLKVEEMPVLSFFGPKDAEPHVPAMKAQIKKKGFPGLLTISCNSLYFNNIFDVNSYYNILKGETGSREALPYKELTSFAEYYWSKCKKDNPTNEIAPLVMVGWDSRPWHKDDNILYYVDRSVAVFRDHLDKAFRFVTNNSKRCKLIFIYAWNELGEGGYLIPTKEDPNANYLLQISKERKKWENKLLDY